MTLPLPWPFVSDPQQQANNEAIAKAMPTPGASPGFWTPKARVIVNGVVTAVGAIAQAGTGDWTVARTGGAPAGDYTVTFTNAFASANIVVTLTPLIACFFNIFPNPAVGSFRYQTYNGAVVLADVAMHFSVTGPSA